MKYILLNYSLKLFITIHLYFIMLNSNSYLTFSSLFADELFKTNIKFTISN